MERENMRHRKDERGKLRPGWGWLFVGVLAFLIFLVPVWVARAQGEGYRGVQPRTPLSQIPDGGHMRNFTLVGRNPLLDPQLGIPRGHNGGITAVRDCLYVGSNIGLQPPLIVDMKDLANPKVMGELPGWIKGRGNGIEAIEAVADLNLLVNPLRVTFAIRNVPIGFDPPPQDRNVALLIYDVTDCRRPRPVARWEAPNNNLHYMTLWRDPNRPVRVLALLTFSTGTPKDGINIRIVDLTGCPRQCNPKQVAEWSLQAEFSIPQELGITYDGGVYRPMAMTHDATFSLDGKTVHMAQQHFGYLQLDSTPLATGQPCNPETPSSPKAAGHCLTVKNPDLEAPILPFGNGVATVHGVVKIPGRPYVSLQHEGHTCPYGGITLAYVGTSETFAAGAPGLGRFRGDLFPRIVGVFGLPENQVDRCPREGVPPGRNTLTAERLRTSHTVHNVLAFPNIMFATWYGGGLRAIDISNPYAPFELGFFFNKPAREVRWCGEETLAIRSCADPERGPDGLPFRVRQINPPDVFARSYPIVMNGHIVYSDENMGVYVLKYSGRWAGEIPRTGICIAHNPNVTSPGFEPCPPYKD